MHSRFNSPLLMWALIFLGGWICRLVLPHTAIWQPNMFNRGVGVVLLIVWIVVFLWALQTNRQAARDVTTITKLRTDGPYAHVRHPIYSADYLFGLSLVLLNPHWWMLAAVMWAWIIWTIWMRTEERGLIVQFGDEYRAYMQRVPRWWPRW